MSLPYALRFFLLSGVFFTEAIWLRDRFVLPIIFICFAVAFFLVALAYLGLGPGIFLKRPDGTRDPKVWLALGPYLALTHFSAALQRLASREPPFSRILPSLILGRLPTAREATKLCDEGVVAVVDLTCEFPEAGPLRTRAAYLCVPVLDATAPTLEQLHVVSRFILEHSRRGTVFVHCALGHGRSATVVIAFLLMSSQARLFDEAIALVTAQRPGVAPNAAQRRRLAEFAAGLANQ